MKTKILIDINIFVYAFNKGSDFHGRASDFLDKAEFDFCTSTKNISEYFAVLSKMRQPFGEVFDFYREILEHTTVFFPTQNSLSVFETLLKKYQPVIGNKVFDLEISSIAIANGIPEIKTVNTKDFVGISEISISTL